jgi:hypothetical protein
MSPGIRFHADRQVRLSIDEPPRAEARPAVEVKDNDS